jgi:dienelactone hydrolase
MQSIEMNQPFLDAVEAAGGSVDLFDGADHGFAVPGIAYHDDSANRAYTEALALFRERLGSRLD